MAVFRKQIQTSIAHFKGGQGVFVAQSRQSPDTPGIGGLK